MRMHTKTFHIRFTEKEYERLCEYSAKAGLPKSTYIRFMINGQTPKNRPPIDYHKMIKELHHIGNNLNQLTQSAYRFGNIHAKELEKIKCELLSAISEIMDEFTVPNNFDKADVLNKGKLQAEKDRGVLFETSR